MVIMQVDTFVNKRMKILYALSFICGGTAQVWAVNKTMAVINGTSPMQTLDIFLENIKRTLALQRSGQGMHGSCTAS